MIRLGIHNNLTPSVGLGLNSIRAAGVGGGSDPLLAAMLAESPIIAYDNNNLGTFWADTAGTTPATINGAVARQDDVSGNGFHRTQATLANRPALRGTPTGANLFSAYSSPGAGWVDSGSGVATATATTNSISGGVAAVIGRVYRVRYTCTVTGGSVRFSLGGVNGVTRTASGTYEEHITASSTAALAFAGVSSFTGTVSAVDVRDASADAVSAPYFLQYDGADDFMQTASVNMTATDEVTACVGVRKLIDAVVGVLLEFSTNANTNTGSFTMAAPDALNLSYSSLSRGDATAASGQRAETAAGAFPAPNTAVLTATHDISGDLSVLRVNAVSQTNGTADKGAGNFGNYSLYFGRRGGTSAPFNGLDYGCCIFPTLKSGAALDAIEAFIANRTGVTLP